MQQLLNAQINALVQKLVELLDIPLGLNACAGQVHRGEAEISPAAGGLPLAVVDIAHYPGAAAHIGYLRVVVALLIVLQVEGGVDKAEVGEEPLCRDPHCQLEQVVVRVLRVIVYALLHLEYLHREDGRLAVPKAGLGS